MMKIFIACSGLGRIKRGYEAFAQECFTALSAVPEFDIFLFKGGGESTNKQIALWNLPRHCHLAQQLSQITEKLFGRGAYFIEQITFGLSLLPHIYRHKPDVIYFSDENLGNLLWYWRCLTRQQYKLLFRNGGPINPPFPRWDWVQQLVPVHLQAAIKAGEPKEKQSLIPHGMKINKQMRVVSAAEKAAKREQLGLPANRNLILSVGAINKSHKRMDYVIQEVAKLPEPRPYLIILGQQEPESSEIISLGNDLLGTKDFQAKTVEPQAIADYYQSADIFVLASLHEGFGRAFLEAMAFGLPCLAHDYEVSRFVLGKSGYFANFNLPGSLAKLIIPALAASKDELQRRDRHRTAWERFSWEKLLPDYIQLIGNCYRANLGF